MFMYSSDGGENLSHPEQFTPSSTPPIDFRHVSIAPTSGEAPADDDNITVHNCYEG